MSIYDLPDRVHARGGTVQAALPALLPETARCSCTQCRQRQQLSTQRRFIMLVFLASLLCLALMSKRADAAALSTLPVTLAQQGTFDCGTVTEIPQIECEALVALYNSTNGPGWADSTGWLATATPCGWVGVSCGGGQVQGLTLFSKQLSGIIPVALSGLTSLQELDLYGNQLTGVIPVELGNLSNLHRLSLSNNQLSGSIPIELANLTNLQDLSLYGNQLTGTIPVELSSLIGLQQLYLSSNELSGTIPVELSALVNLETLWLHDNRLTGTIPAEFGQLTNLTSLILSSNQLDGQIPAELSALANLQTLWLHDNQLTGTIPAEIGQLTNLADLSLFNNQLSGTIPIELATLTNLQDLSLHGNQLIGAIPAEFGELANLTYLSLNNNQLDGPLPLSLMQLTLSDFRFDNTNLCEPTDPTFQTWLAGIATLQRTNIPCPDPDQLLSVHLLAFDNHVGNIDTNLTPSYPAVVEGALVATQGVLTKTVALLVDLDGVGDTHVVIIRNGAVIHLLGEADLNLRLAQKFAGWQLPIVAETTVEALLPAGDGTLTAPAVYEYDMADGTQLGGFLQWLFNTYIEDATATQTLLSYIGHGAAVVPADDVAAALGVTTCDEVDYGQPAGNTGIIALPGGSLGAHPAFTDCHGQPNATTGDYRPTLLAPHSLADAISMALANSPVTQIDLLDLFHCFALSLEALAEFAGDPANGIAPLADTIIGSPNYTYFTPAMVGDGIAGDRATQSAAQRAAAILTRYDQQIQNSGNSTAYPRLLVAVAGANLQPLLAAWEGVATRLHTLIETQGTQSATHQLLKESYAASAKYDTTYCAPQDWQLAVPDALSDLGDFARHLAEQSNHPELITAAKLVIEEVQAAVQTQIAVDGIPTGLNPAAQTPWTFANHTGLSLYTDLGFMEIPGYGENRSWQAYWYHNGTNGNPAPYTFTAHSQWDEVLHQFWQIDDPNGDVNAVFCLPELVLLPTSKGAKPTDLAVAAITAPTASTLIPGEPVHFTAEIATTTATTRYIDVRFDVTINGTPVFTETVVITRLLAAGEVISVTTSNLWSPEGSGTARLTVTVDPRDRIDETDEDNNSQSHTYTIGSPINLHQGWNLIALPVAPTNPTPAAVFAPIAGSYDQVYGYNGCDAADPWKSYDPNAPLPQLNDLTAITPQQGLWIHVTQATTFVPTGTALGTVHIPLCPGWNMVGYPSVDPVPLPQALATIGGQYTQILAYDSADSTDSWKTYDPNAPLPQLNDLTAMEAGNGYWIEAGEATTIIVE